MKFKKYPNKVNDKVYGWEGKHINIGAFLKEVSLKEQPSIKYALYHYGLMAKANFIGYTSTVKQAEEIINRIYCLGSFKECTEVMLNKEIVKLVMKDNFFDVDLN